MGSEWEVIAASGLQKTPKSESELASPSMKKKASEFCPDLVDMSIFSNAEQPMDDGDILKNTFAENEIEWVKQEAHKKAQTDYQKLRAETELQFERERKKLEDLFLEKIVAHEATIEEMKNERENMEKELIETRSKLSDNKNALEMIDLELTRMKQIEVESSTIKSRIDALVEQQKSLKEEKAQLKKELVDKTSKIQELEDTIVSLMKQHEATYESNK